MKIVLFIFGVLLIFIGSVWFLQGINVLPGSFMTGDVRWARNGGFAIAIGVVLLFLANRRGRG